MRERRYRAKKIDPVRELAVQVLSEVCNEGAYANVALVRAMRTARLTDRDRRFLTELVYGTVKAGDTLDYMIAQYLTDGIERVQPQIREILRIGIYQLFFMNKVPASAACDTAVELAKKYGRRGADSFVNAVLRTAVRTPGRAEIPAGRDARLLALRTQHPLWMVERWIRAYGYERTEELCRCNNTSAPLSLRVNTLRTTRDALLAQLWAAGVTAVPSERVPDGIVVTGHGGLDALTPLREGLCQVQDESSMLVAHVLGAAPGMTVIDACAAPGGKATHIAQLMENRGHIRAFDIYEGKISRIENNAKRLGIDIIETAVRDAREIGVRFAGTADRVLVDAPCSGFGVLRRKPDARWRRKRAELKNLPKLQREILESAAAAVKPGGALVYSTCTMEEKENDRVVAHFLEAHPEFTLAETGAFLPCEKRPERTVRICPTVNGPDGFFIARMERL
ncbi:16S rRNA (cytosine(967)-C(5))-methyltransferase RsmB [Selenomonas sp. F0473]|uniref:16S rRNA (cytosine(967)-C(5))-methyltransferase RsmB n=1 Tax=Selenomonas sp. F0473 TaxID=999423 RepID=UPI00029EB2F6|nr:16S rRNA (cytosine(967)-C(5))-methyltransferase RsmB [Selenomonas sp. F0473]EKU71849.1 ribosomal RNA small subunit methyltransferase B [Selenomonas sp. F0473]